MLRQGVTGGYRRVGEAGGEGGGGGVVVVWGAGRLHMYRDRHGGGGVGRRVTAAQRGDERER